MSKKAMFSKGFWIAVVLTGLILSLGTGFVTYSHLYKQVAERSAGIVEYVKTQSLIYDSYNDANIMKSQFRAMESVQQVARDVAASPAGASCERLEQSTGDLGLTGAFVLDKRGGLVEGYSHDGVGYADLKAVLTDASVADVARYPKKVYSTRVTLGDGSYVDVACAARIDKEGIVVGIYHTQAEFANRYMLSLQSLLEGYDTENDSSIIIESDGGVVASNTLENGASANASYSDSDRAVVDEIKARCQPGETHLVRGNNIFYYGSYDKAREYYVYTFTRASRIFHYMGSNSVAMLTVYVLIVYVYVFSRRRAEQSHLEDMVEQEREYAAQLKVAAQAAQSANNAKTEFLQRMSHDIRTPINGIRGMVEVGNAFANDMEKQTECREKIWTASGTLLDLVNEVLDMSKLESGEIELDVRPTNIVRQIDDVCEMLERQAQERHITIERAPYEIEHPCVMASSIHLKRLVMNIASNAVKYNKFGGSVRICCREQSFADGRATYEVTIADTGIGMSEKFQKHLFEPFAREMQDNGYKPSGTGLGMSIAKQLVETMGGTIAFESKLGKGTTYTITLPFDVADEEECDKGDLGSEPSGAMTLEGINILLADDNELNREIAEFVITQAGATLTSVHDGESALATFAASPVGSFDVILMDIMMPGMDGYETTRAIRALARDDAEKVVIIAMSANAFADDRLASREAGMNEHLAKPLDSTELIKTIKAELRH